MKNWLSKLPPETTQLTRSTNAYRVAIILLVTLVTFDIFSTYNYLIHLTTLLLLAMLLSYAATMSTLVSTWLIRQGRVNAGVWGLILTSLIALLLSPLLGPGLGIIYGVSAIVITAVIAGQGLASHHLARANLVGIIFGIAIYILDISLPSSNATNLNVGFTGIILFALLLILVLIVARQFRSYSLRTKLTMGFLLVAVLSVSLVGVITSLVARAELTKAVGKSVDSLASTIAQQVGNTLNSQLEVLQVIATRFDRIAESASLQYSGTPEEIESNLLQLDAEWRAADGTAPIVLNIVNNNPSSLLRDFRRTIPAHEEIFLTDRYGANIAATNRTTDFYQADEDWWQAAYNNGEGALFISQPVYDQSAEVFSIEFAVPVFANGRLVGILRTTYNANILAEILQNVELGGSGHADIRIADDLLLGLEAADLQVIDLETQAELDKIAQGFGEIVLEGNNVLASQAPLFLADTGDPHEQAIGNLGWSVIVHQDANEAFAPVETTTRTITLVSIGLLFGTGLLAYYISLNLASPIVKLTEVAEKVRGGDLDAQAEVTSQDEIGTLASTFNSMTTQVRTLVGTLEQRVAERTRALATSTEVSRRLSTILDQNELVRQVVEQVQQAFNYYHTHIYLWDDKHENLVMAGGTGEAGRIMLASGHSIPAERGLVGRAAETGTVVLIPDVTQTIGWLANPLLPDTKAEIAVPIILGEEVLGVLDVQHYIVGGLSQNDADLLQSIANQVAIALQNARAYASAQLEAGREARRNEIVQKIQSSTSVDEALKIAVRELGRALGTEASVRLKSDGGHENQKITAELVQE